MHFRQTLLDTWQRLTGDFLPAQAAPDLSGAFERVSFSRLTPTAMDMYHLHNRSMAVPAPDIQSQRVTYNFLINAKAQQRIDEDPAPPELSGELRAQYLLHHGAMPLDGLADGRLVHALVLERSDGARIEVSSINGRDGMQQLYDQSGKSFGAPRRIEF